ncbi:hypothetical protein B0H34DRAFT_799416 [Crassisporium funariophilum]|nr:hypothetical protein B0H34DRAFT_799416 [Crassisporium funariophilum]
MDDTHLRKEPVLNANGYTVCPDCNTRVHCGIVGLANLEKHHWPSKACKEAREEQDKNQKKKSSNILSFFTKSKAPPVPAAISSSALRAFESAAPSKAVIALVFKDILQELQYYLDNLPGRITQSAHNDILAVMLAGDPDIRYDSSLQGNKLWEEGLNNFLKSVLGWGMKEDVKRLIQAKTGLKHLLGFVQHFIVKRGVSEGLFKGKLMHLFDGLRELRSKAAPTAELPDFAGSPSVTCITPDTQQIVDVNAFEFKNPLKGTKASGSTCNGRALAFSEGMSPHTAYLFALHDVWVLPWSKVVRNGKMSLFLDSCTGTQDGKAISC